MVWKEEEAQAWWQSIKVSALAADEAGWAVEMSVSQGELALTWV